jgi:hypothetical protein
VNWLITFIFCEGRRYGEETDVIRRSVVRIGLKNAGAPKQANNSGRKANRVISQIVFSKKQSEHAHSWKTWQAQNNNLSNSENDGKGAVLSN